MNTIDYSQRYVYLSSIINNSGEKRRMPVQRNKDANGEREGSKEWKGRSSGETVKRGERAYGCWGMRTAHIAI